VRWLKLTPHGARLMRTREASRAEAAAATLGHIEAGRRHDLLELLEEIIGAGAEPENLEAIV
jgi:hypothetical protein